MADRRRARLLRELSRTTYGWSDGHLEKLFGKHVHSLIKELFLANHVERDGADRIRLTVSGRVLASRFVAKKRSAA